MRRAAFAAVAAITVVVAVAIGCAKGGPARSARPHKPPPSPQPGEPVTEAAPATAAAGAAKAGEVVKLTEADFQKKTSKGVVLVDFWAPWCPPCRKQGPIVEAVAKKFAGKAWVCKLNVDDAKPVAEKFGVRGIPTLIVFKDGEEVSRMVGLRQEEELSKEIEKALGR